MRKRSSQTKLHYDRYELWSSLTLNSRRQQNPPSIQQFNYGFLNVTDNTYHGLRSTNSEHPWFKLFCR